MQRGKVSNKVANCVILLPPFPSFSKEASWLSSLLPELKEKGVSLYGIVHEEKGANSFNKYLNGEMLFDEEVTV